MQILCGAAVIIIKLYSMIGIGDVKQLQVNMVSS